MKRRVTVVLLHLLLAASLPSVVSPQNSLRFSRLGSAGVGEGESDSNGYYSDNSPPLHITICETSSRHFLEQISRQLAADQFYGAALVDLKGNDKLVKLQCHDTETCCANNATLLRNLHEGAYAQIFSRLRLGTYRNLHKELMSLSEEWKQIVQDLFRNLLIETQKLVKPEFFSVAENIVEKLQLIRGRRYFHKNVTELILTAFVDNRLSRQGGYYQETAPYASCRQQILDLLRQEDNSTTAKIFNDALLPLYRAVILRTLLDNLVNIGKIVQKPILSDDCLAVLTAELFCNQCGSKGTRDSCRFTCEEVYLSCTTELNQTLIFWRKLAVGVIDTFARHDNIGSLITWPTAFSATVQRHAGPPRESKMRYLSSSRDVTCTSIVEPRLFPSKQFPRTSSRDFAASISGLNATITKLQKFAPLLAPPDSLPPPLCAGLGLCVSAPQRVLRKDPSKALTLARRNLDKTHEMYLATAARQRLDSATFSDDEDYGSGSGISPSTPPPFYNVSVEVASSSSATSTLSSSLLSPLHFLFTISFTLILDCISIW